MNKETKDLLSEVTQHRLEHAITMGAGTEEGKIALEDAMKAVDREIKLEELEAAREEQELEARSKRKEFWIRVAEVGGALLLAPVIDYACKKSFAKLVCAFEDENYFRKTPGKSLSGLFRFKK